MSPASLTSLPVELITHIANLAAPSTHLNLALASRYLHGSLTVILEHHARYHQRFRVVSDILPLTLPELLAGGKLDRIALWHVRSVEIWGGRLSWADWQPYSYTLREYPPDDIAAARAAAQASAAAQARRSRGRGGNPLIPPTQRVVPLTATSAVMPIQRNDSSPAAHPYAPRFTEDELDAFTALMEDELHFDHASAWQWRNSIEEGCDIALKGLVVALCPRLRNLRVVMMAGETRQQDVVRNYLERLVDPNEHVAENVIETPCRQELVLRFISKAIRLVVTSENNNDAQQLLWPPGLASLRDVAVGIQSLATPPAQNLTVDSNGVPAWLNTPAITPFFALPGIESLYAAGLARPDYDGSAAIADPCLKPASSSIKRLFLSECTVGHETILRMIETCTSIETLTFQRCNLEDFSADTLCLALARHHKASAEKSVPPPGLVTYACKYRGYRARICDPWECAYFSTVSAADLALCGAADEEEDGGSEEFTEHLAELLVSWPFPFINLTDLESSGDYIRPERLQTLLDDTLTHVFENDLAALDRDGFKLRAIFLGEIEMPCDRTVGGEKFRFRKAIVAGRKVGVDIITAAIPVSDEVRGLLPRGACEKDLESSPWRGLACVEEVEVHPETGMRLAGCNSCGECKSCYDKYPEELWRERDSGTYFTEENLERWKIEDAMSTY